MCIRDSTCPEASGGAAARLRAGNRKAVGVVLASAGYPAAGPAGVPIDGVADAAALEDVLVFHSGTASGSDGRLVTAGGRVLTVVGCASTYSDAIGRAYAGVQRIRFDGMQYRRDIGRKAVQAVRAEGRPELSPSA